MLSILCRLSRIKSKIEKKNICNKNPRYLSILFIIIIAQLTATAKYDPMEPYVRVEISTRRYVELHCWCTCAVVLTIR